MRTSLTTVIGLCNLSMGRYSDKELQGCFRSIKNSSEYLLSLLTDISDMQKLDSGAVTLHQTICGDPEIAEIAKSIVSPLAKAKNIRFVTDFHCQHLNCYLKADAKRLLQIILNLLMNAVTYTQPGGEVRWEIHVESRADDRVIFRHTISDNGPGMADAFQRLMYESFTQEHTNAAGSGSGLGLSIVKKLVDLMGGTILCASELGKGTTFTVSLPHEKATKEEIAAYLAAQQTPVSAAHRPWYILICEDNDINAEMLRQLLLSKGITFCRAVDGMQGIEMARAEHCDAILMDMRMPNADGYEAARAICQFDSATPIIALSANNFPEDTAGSFASGMNAHIAKPIDIKELFSTLNQLIS